MRAIVTTFVAVLAIGLAAPAAAPAREVTGGGTFSEAPLVGPGTYTDTLLPRETLLYAVRLSAGQRLTVRGTVDVSVGNRDRGIPVARGGFSLDIYTPLRQRLARDNVLETENGDFESEQSGLAGPRVLSAPAADRREAQGVGDWTGPGVYHVAAVITSMASAVVEFPLTLEIEIDGAARGAPADGPLGDPRTGPRRTPARPATASAPAPDGIAPIALVAAGLSALVAGALLGTVGSARRRRRRGGP
jgi:Ca-activated chloride channel family protein